MIGPTTQKRRPTTPPASVPGTGHGLGVLDVRGWIGHNGSLPGYAPLAVCFPPARVTLVVPLNTDIDHKGSEPGTRFGDAITEIVTPRHLFDLPAQPAARRRAGAPKRYDHDRDVPFSAGDRITRGRRCGGCDGSDA
ncbi:hypothetical protein [Streptomyces sp. NBC_00647]|uniref:hypothetical protein n=1 Tax=Streptomyces sp. NBC_00647 TaxID=2975796 RepID=UPI003863F432